MHDDKFNVHSQPASRKSRSISRYFLGNKRASVHATTHEHAVHRCLTAHGIFDAVDLSAHVTSYRDDTACRRLFILTDKNQLIIAKSYQRQSLYKVKQRIDVNRLWVSADVHSPGASEITPLTDYDASRSLLLGWPLAENFLIEFETKSVRDIWKERIQSILRLWWQTTSATVEHVRIVIDQNQQSDHRQPTPSFLIRKVIGVRSHETVRDLIRKCIDAFHLRDPVVDNYVLFVRNTVTHGTPTQQQHRLHSSSQSTPTANISLIGHEYPYSIKMKHVKAVHSGTWANNRSFDGNEHLSYPKDYNHSSASLNNVTAMHFHDFELRKRETISENPTKKHRFFHKRRAKTPLPQSDEYHSSSTPYLSSPNRPKTPSPFFGQPLDELVSQHDQQLPPVIMQLLEILHSKGPETIGIFRKVANARSVKNSIDKIERRVALAEEDIHPILAAGVFKHFLRHLPEPMFTSMQYEQWKKCLRLATPSERIFFARTNILFSLADANHVLLKGFICVLHRISQNGHANGMTPFNLGLCVSNSLFKTESTTIVSGKQEADVMSSIVEFLIENCAALFGADVMSCIVDKRILVQKTSSLTCPTASSIESLDEVESSPHLPTVDRSHDSGLAASDQLFNDDSSEISESIRRHTASLPSPMPDWSASITAGKGLVQASIPIPIVLYRRRSSKATYKPSRQFLAREQLTQETTDESDNNSSMRSSAATLQNSTINKIRRSKSLSRHASLGSSEQQQQQQHRQKHLTKDSRRLNDNDVKRTSSLKQIHHSSEDGGDDDDEHEHHHPSKRLPPPTSKKVDRCLTPRCTKFEQQDLDLTSASLSTLTKSPSVLKPRTPIPVQAFHPSSQPGHSHPPISVVPTPNKIYLLSRNHHRPPPAAAERTRTFVHHSNSRPFVLSPAVQMRPVDHEHRRRTLLDARIIEPDRSSRHLTQVIVHPQAVRYSPLAVDAPDGTRPWSVREKAKFFEHAKFSTGRENYV